MDTVNSRQADPSFGHIDDPAHRQIVLSVVNSLQICQNIFDFPAGIEVNSPNNLVGNVHGNKFLLEKARLGIGSIQNGTVIVRRPFLYTLFDILRDKLSFVIPCVKLTQSNFFSLPVVRPKRLFLASFVITDHPVGRIQNIFRRAVVLLQLDHPGVREFLLKIKYITDICPTEFINRLVIIPHNTEITIFARQQAYQLKLHGVCILILVHHDVAESFLIVLKHIGLSVQKLHGPDKQIIKVQRIVRLKLSLIFPVHLGDLLLSKITSCIQLEFIRHDHLVLCRRDH